MPRRRPKVDDEEIELRRDVIAALRGHKPKAGRCNLAADALEAFWFPTSKAVRDRRAKHRSNARRFWAEIYREEIDDIAAAKGIPKHEAKKEVVKHWKLQSVEALEQFLKRES